MLTSSSTSYSLLLRGSMTSTGRDRMTSRIVTVSADVAKLLLEDVRAEVVLGKLNELARKEGLVRVDSATVQQITTESTQIDLNGI
jgi:hypothetical protein